MIEFENCVSCGSSHTRDMGEVDDHLMEQIYRPNGDKKHYFNCLDCGQDWEE